MKIKNCDSFFKFALLLSGNIQWSPGPISDVCFVCKRTFNKISFCYTKCNLRTQKSATTRSFLIAIYVVTVKDGRIYYSTMLFCIDNSGDTESSLLEDNLPSILSHNEAWKVFKDKGMHFGLLNVNSLLFKIWQLKTLATNTNISVPGITETKLDNCVSNEELKWR